MFALAKDKDAEPSVKPTDKNAAQVAAAEKQFALKPMNCASTLSNLRDYGF